MGLCDTSWSKMHEVHGEWLPGWGSDKQCDSWLVTLGTQPPCCEKASTCPLRETTWKATGRGLRHLVDRRPQPAGLQGNKYSDLSSPWPSSLPTEAPRHGAEISQLHSALSKLLTHGIRSTLRGCTVPFWGDLFQSDSDWNTNAL